MNKFYALSSRRSAGISLIELMVALAIGTVLILALVQVFGASRTAYQMSEGIARVQENGRFAMDFLQRDLRMAGHFGCVNDQAHFVKNEGDPVNHLAMGGAAAGQGHPHDFSVSIQAYEANGTGPGDSVTIGSPGAGWTPGLPTGIAALGPLPGSDVIVLRYFGSRGTPVTSIGATALTIPTPSDPGNPPDGWTILTDEGVSGPTLFGIADCSHADVFSGSGGAGTVNVPAAVAPLLSARFNPHPAGQTTLYRANSIVYYVGAGASGPALYRARYNGGSYTAEELVEGIESLQLLFGMDQTDTITVETPPTGNITEHRTADGLGVDVGQWRRVGLVQVGMLVSSPDRAAAPQATSGEATDLRVLGVRHMPAAANDTHYRTAYEASIALRNRLFGN